MEHEFTLPPFTAEEIFTPLSQSIDWGVKTLGIPNMWKETEGEGITIVIIDTGFPGVESHTHPDLENNAIREKSKSVINGEDMYDRSAGHSTSCAGIIAAENNEIGYVGYAPKAKIICIKALSNNGAGSLKNIEDALEYALELKPDIVSMSLGAPRGSSKMHSIIKKLDDMGIPVVTAAGNGGAKQGVLYPAKYDECFAIGAYNSNGKIANFSAVGPEVDFAFPGVNINTTYLNDGYATVNGTSFACPACAGVLALIMSKHKKAVAEGREKEYKSTMDLYDILKSVSHNPNTPDKQDVYFGWGIVDVSKLAINTLSVEDTPEKTTYHSSFVRFLLSVKRFFQSLFRH